MAFWQDMLDGFISGNTPEPLVNKKLGLEPALSEWRPGFLVKRWKVDPDLFHGRALFGGYIAAIADQVLGLTAMTVLKDGYFFGTTNMSISYLSPVMGGELRVEGEVIRQRSKSIYVECSFYCDGEIVAKASATQVMYENKM
jgi:acyl-coenzyme A thioesterase PaaI-like protein